jgi:hypothetical protein
MSGPAKGDLSARAPLFVDALALSQWLIERFGAARGPLEDRLIGLALELLQILALALKDRDREARIERADELLIRLRALLRLAMECGRLTAPQYGHVLERVDAIGRQLGAWQRSLGAL